MMMFSLLKLFSFLIIKQFLQQMIILILFKAITVKLLIHIIGNMVYIVKPFKKIFNHSNLNSFIIVDVGHYYYHVYCAYHDHSLWIKDHYNYVYKYINNNKR